MQRSWQVELMRLQKLWRLKMNISLYELKDMYLNLMDLDLEDEDLRAALENIDDEIEIKAENYAGVIKNLEAEVEAYKKRNRKNDKN